jgi:isopentenyl diphosphate isomerase/L-lactate dehydrogenase-like FMN-dependent dehydrogenase
VGLTWHQGEIAAARAAAAAGIPYTLSTASITPMEAVAEQAGGDLWFQIYVWPRFELAEEVVQRASRAGYRVLLVTADAVVPSNREYNRHNAFSVPIRVSRRNAWDVARHPRWVMQVMLRALLAEGVPEFANLPAEFRTDLRGKGSQRLMPPNAPITPEVLRRLRAMWRGPLLLKGVLSAGDARMALECGADGVVVSNHGGRTLDGALAAIEALPDVVDAVGHRMTVLMDSGIRRGSDVVKALALGARAVLVGRAPIWGTAAGGEAGARLAIDILIREVDRVMAQVGRPSVADLDRSLLALRGSFGSFGSFPPSDPAYRSTPRPDRHDGDHDGTNAPYPGLAGDDAGAADRPRAGAGALP